MKHQMVAAFCLVASCGEVTAMTTPGSGGSAAGAAGAGGRGGQAGSAAGAGGTMLADCPAPADLISDFDVDETVSPVSGRSGSWVTFGDDAGRFDASEIAAGNPSCSPAGSLHVKGSGFTVFASAGADLVPRTGAIKGTYDARAYRGVSFWAKMSASVYRLQVVLSDIYSDGAAPAHDMPDPANPGTNLCTACTCIYTTGSPVNCSPFMGEAHDLDGVWRRFEVLFADATQDPANPGYHPPANKLDTSRMTSIAIRVVPPQAAQFEMWIDDVAFVR